MWSFIAERKDRRLWDDCWVSTIDLLLSDDGQHLLNRLPEYDASESFRLTASLRDEGYSPELVAAALTQSRLRGQASAKFGPFASHMLFTADGLEQATRLNVGVFHAQRLRSAGATRVIDLGCGIGADSMAFAGLGLEVRSIEIDPETAAVANFNLSSFPEAEVINADAFDIDLESLGADALWLDPARRLNGKRINDPAKWMPSLKNAIELARAFPAAGIKVAPGIDYSDLPEDAHVQWISVDGDLLEAVIWLGGVAGGPGRSALVITDGTPRSVDVGVADPRETATMVEPRELGAYVYESDPALVRSGAIAWLCSEYDLAPVSSGIAYLTGDEPIDSPLLRGFQVCSVHGLNAKELRSHLSASGVGRVEIKKRGTDVEPELLRKKLKLDRALPGEATIIATPLLGKHRAIHAIRL